MNDLKNNTDTYIEHEQHILGENGKIVPFFRNMKNCSTCFSQHLKIKQQRSEHNKGTRVYDNITRNPELE